MSTIRVKQTHSFDRDEARNRFASFEEMMGKYGAKLDWNGYTAAIKGIGVSGDVHVLTDAVEIVLKLGMMAKAAGVDPVRLEGSITRRLEAAFTDPQTS